MDEDSLELALRELDRKSNIREALPILAAALASENRELRETATHAIHFVGRGVTADDVDWLKSQLADTGLELAARVVLLNYLFGNGRADVEARAQHIEHVFWIIANAPSCTAAARPAARLYTDPEDSELWTRYEQAWLGAVDAYPESAQVHLNAALGLQQHDWQTAARLLRRAIDIEPESTDARQWLAHGYRRQAYRGTPVERQSLSRFALKQFEDLLAIELAQAERQALMADNDAKQNVDSRVETATTMVRSRHLHDLARAALESGELDLAAEYAQAGLVAAMSSAIPEFFRNDGNAVHHNNLVLGRVALQRGDVATASRHLLEAGKTVGSPQLNSFGPNMQLAAELLEGGEKEVVLEYLNLCGKFWSSHQDSLDTWKAKIRAGKPPLFGANLRY